MAERRLHITHEDGWVCVEDGDTYEQLHRGSTYDSAEQFILGYHAAERRKAKEDLAKLLDDEGYGAWVDTAQLVETLRQHRPVVEAALKGHADD